MANSRYYEEALKLRDKYGWDNKEWARRVDESQRTLEAMERGTFPEDPAMLERIKRLTMEGAAKSTKHLLRFKQPVIIGCCIHKGGSGKTTCAVTLAEELAHRGYNVLLIDSDSQMDATSTVLGKDEDSEKNLFVSLSCARDIRTQTCETDYDRLDIVPSSTRMGSAEAMLMSQASYSTLHSETTFRTVMQGVVEENYYDFVFVDMDKTIGYLNRTILNGCTHLLMVSECSFYNLSGVAVMNTNFEDIKATSNKDLELLGVVFNRVSMRKSIVKKILEDFDQMLPGKMFHTAVRADTNVEKAQWDNEVLRVYNGSCNAYKDLCAIADEMLERLKPLSIQ